MVPSLESKEDRSNTDPNIVSLRTIVEQQAPIVLPWCKGTIFFGNGFDSRLALDNKLPWTGRTAFANLHSTVFVSNLKCKTATFRESTSSASKASTEHMSASLGVTVGCKYLSVNVTGSYDESTSTSENATRASRHGAYRAGQLTFDEMPTFSTEGKEAFVKDRSGFSTLYGDYYVAGLELGGDVSVCFSLASDATSRESEVKVSVTAHSLFGDATDEHTERKSEAQQHSDFTFSAYNTLTQKFEQQHCSRPEERRSVLTSAGVYLRQIESLRLEVDRVLDKYGLQHGHQVSWSRVMEVCMSGLVSHVMLLPYSKLPEYIEIGAIAQAHAVSGIN